MSIHEQLRKEFQEKAGLTFDAMFDRDQQEQLITLVQREDRILQKGAELQAWLLGEHAEDRPFGRPGSQRSLALSQVSLLGRKGWQ